MAKYVVEGFIRVKMTVEADSDDEAIEMAGEAFDREKHLDEDAEPEWEVANEIEPDLDDEDDDTPIRTSIVRYNDEDDDDN